MLELKAILLTQGMHGMVSQVEGLARALGLSYKHQNIELKSFWNLIPPKFAPISENLVKEKFISRWLFDIEIFSRDFTNAMQDMWKNFLHHNSNTKK